MDIVPSPAFPALPTCPTCGLPAELTAVRRDEGTHTIVGSYACGNAHPWTMRWMDVA